MKSPNLVAEPYTSFQNAINRVVQPQAGLYYPYHLLSGLLNSVPPLPGSSRVQQPIAPSRFIAFPLSPVLTVAQPHDQGGTLFIFERSTVNVILNSLFCY